MGGTMRWARGLQLEPIVRAQSYGKLEISERHRHRYEFNRDYEKTLVAAGLKSRTHADENYVEIVEAPDHRGSSAASSIQNSNPSRRTHPLLCSVHRRGPRAQRTESSVPGSSKRTQTCPALRAARAPPITVAS